VEASRLNRVIIAGSRDATTLEIPWDSRDALLERLRREGDADAIIAAFQAVGATRPVQIPRQAKRQLLAHLEAWLVEVHATGLPDGLFELRNALHDEAANGALD
jgi:hypothetical protein